MTVVKISFKPEDLKYTDEAYLPFQEGGMLLRFWGLYKKTFLTSDEFKNSLQLFSDYLARVADEDDETEMYATPIEFQNVLVRVCKVPTQGFLNRPLLEWIVKYWDHFNPNIQKKIQIVYNEKVLVEQTKEIAA